MGHRSCATALNGFERNRNDILVCKRAARCCSKHAAVEHKSVDCCDTPLGPSQDGGACLAPLRR
eukprot:12042644-Heterocapsa_arctica.AAC.1